MIYAHYFTYIVYEKEVTYVSQFDRVLLSFTTTLMYYYHTKASFNT